MNAMQRVKDILKYKYEGKVFKHLSLTYMDTKYLVSETYYLVINGIIYFIDSEYIKETDMTFLDLSLCSLLGKYDENKVYKTKKYEFNKKDFNNFLKKHIL